MGVSDRGPTTWRRLVQRIQDECGRLGGYPAVSRDIEKANLDAGIKRTVEWRKLRRVVLRQAHSFSFRELDALGSYFEAQGTSLGEVLGTPSLVKEIVRRGTMVFLLGAKPQAQYDVVLSQWDIHAMADVIRTIHRTRASSSWFISDVQLQRGQHAPSARTFQERFASSRWFQLIDQDESNLLCLGSPLACHAAELMLARMFRVPPFTRRRRSSRATLPFSFIWAPSAYRDLPSSFAKNGEECPGLARRLASMPWSSWGLELDSRVCEDEGEHVQDSWTSYGVIAVQRRRAGNYWVVAAGVTGPSTYATSQAMEEISPAVDHGSPGRESPVTWAVVRSKIVRDRTARGQEQWSVSGHEIVGKPRYRR